MKGQSEFMWIMAFLFSITLLFYYGIHTTTTPQVDIQQVDVQQNWTCQEWVNETACPDYFNREFLLKEYSTIGRDVSLCIWNGTGIPNKISPKLFEFNEAFSEFKSTCIQE